MIYYKIYSLIVAIFDFMHTMSMYVAYTLITDSLFYVVKNQTPKKLGVMLTHLFGLSILLLQVIIQRAEFFKNITVRAEPEFFNTVGQCGQFSWEEGSYKKKNCWQPRAQL